MNKVSPKFLLPLLSFVIASCRDESTVQPLVPVTPGPILFVSDKTGTPLLYSMQEDGSGVQQLTTDTTFPIAYAAWSPDGKKIAFTSGRGGVEFYGPAVWVMNSDGTALHQLTQPSKTDSFYASGDRPVWSPDGRRIAFHRVMFPEARANTDLFVIDADGRHERRLTATVDTAEFVSSWSPDGRYLYFSYFDYTRTDTVGTLMENSRVARIEVDSRVVENVSPTDEVDSGPVPSPDDSLIVVATLGAYAPLVGPSRHLSVLTHDGAFVRTLTSSVYRLEWAVGWSPDGSRILFNGTGDQTAPYLNPPGEILMIGAAGTGMHSITPPDFKTAVTYATSWRKE